MKEHEPASKHYDLERLIFFSDGVFAIVITLLVIDLHPPEHWDFSIAAFWKAESRELLAYAFSFMAVGTYWNLHRRVFRLIAHFHPRLVALNLLLLAFVVLIPFGSKLVIDELRAEPMVIYLGLLVAVGLALALLWLFAAFFGDVVDPQLARRERKAMLVNLLVTPAQLLALLVWALCGGRGAWLPVAVLPIVLAHWFLKRRLGTRG